MSAKRVLVVEDNVALASVVKFNLERSGYSVVVSHDGREAWRRLYDEDFQLAVIDHQMPEMTGEDLCRLIRGYERCAQLPIVMLTAKKYEVNHDVLQKELGVYEIIPKPFSPRALARTVEDCLSGAVAR